MKYSTITAHQKHHGTGEMSDMILATRIAAGWTEQEIAANGRVTRNVAQLVEDADNRANDDGAKSIAEIVVAGIKRVARAEERTMTQAEALALLEGWDDNPDSWEFCDALCAVADALGDDSDDLTSDDLRGRIHELSDDE